MTVGGIRGRSLAAGVAAVAAPMVLWLLLFAIVPPSQQNFPLNDDCLYSRTAFAFARGDGVHYFNQASMPLLGQLLWATPFIWLGGESHVVLRLATMLLGGVAAAAFYDLLRHESGFSPGRAAVVTACLGLNPLFFLLGSMFHSDIPALAFSLLALALYCRGLRADSRGWWAAGALVALLAVATRQNALVAPAAAGILLVLRGRWRQPAWLLGVLLPLTAGVLVDFWLAHRPDVPHLKPELRSLGVAPTVAYIAIHTAGLAAIPLLLLPARWSPRVFWLGLPVMVIVAETFVLREMPPYGGLFPYLGNCFTPWGQFGNDASFPGDRPVWLGDDVRVLLTLVGCVAGAAVAARLVARWRQGGLGVLPLGLFTLLHVPFLCISPYMFDRYLIVLYPGGLAAAAGSWTRSRWRDGLVLLALGGYGLLSFAAVRDFLAWNDAAWKLGERAVARGVAATDIEGGFTWNGWHAPEAAKEKVDRPDLGLALPFTRREFPTVTGRYALSFSEAPDTRTLDTESFRLWLIPGDHRLYFLEPVESSP